MLKERNIDSGFNRASEQMQLCSVMKGKLVCSLWGHLLLSSKSTKELVDFFYTSCSF